MDQRLTATTRVLVVDDSESTRSRLCDLLSEVHGVLVDACPLDRADVLRRVTQTQPDCLVLDTASRDGLGFELLGLLRKLSRRHTIVVLVQDPSREFHRHCRTLGADHLLDKAGEFEVLLDLVAEIANRS